MSEVVELHGTPVLSLSADGEPIGDRHTALDLIGDGWGHEVTHIAVPAARFADDFFQLRSGILGEVAQTFTNYQMRLIVVGDISRHTADSKALRDFVHETNQRGFVWFASSMDDLAGRFQKRSLKAGAPVGSRLSSSAVLENPP